MIDLKDIARYTRQINLKEIGVDGQTKLKNGNVAVIGCGALGSVAAMLLAGAGIGSLILVDFDTIDISNLHRQLYYSPADCGQSKAEALKRKIATLNPDVKIDILQKKVAESDFDRFSEEVDIILECTDNADTKYMVSRESSRRKIPLCIGGVNSWEGQVTTWVPGALPYNSFFPDGKTESFPDGRPVIAPIAGIIGSAQATEALKYIIGCGDLLTDRFLHVDILNWSVSIISARRPG